MGTLEIERDLDVIGTETQELLGRVLVGGKIYYYYEYAREDGAHELRLNVVDA